MPNPGSQAFGDIVCLATKAFKFFSEDVKQPRVVVFLLLKELIVGVQILERRDESPNRGMAKIVTDETTLRTV